MFARSWFYAAVSLCLLAVVAGLSLASNSAFAQSGSGLAQGSSKLSPARQALIADLGDRSPLAGSIGEKMAKRLPNFAGSRSAAPYDPSCWTAVASPNGGPDYNSLIAVSSVSPNDIWAAGYSCCNGDGESDSLVEHWNGSAWSIVPTPNVGGYDNLLVGVVALSTQNVWAVGFAWDGDRFETLVLHWDGRTWTPVSSPNPGQRNNYLDAIDAVSPDDIWAVGAYRPFAGAPFVTMTQHWDGTSWSVVPSPSPSQRNILFNLSALSKNNVWAVGISCDTGDCVASVGRNLIEHWDGGAWSVVPSPNAGAGWNNLTAVDAVKPNDIWAVGSYCLDIDCNNASPLIEHWNGTDWRVSPNNFPGSVNSTYWGIVAIAPNDVWAGGSYNNNGATWANLLSHWDGTRWTNVSVTSPGAYDNDIRALAATGQNNIWAVGDYDNGDGERTQVQQYKGPCR